jgi:hypothetical protein
MSFQPALDHCSHIVSTLHAKDHARPTTRCITARPVNKVHVAAEEVRVTITYDLCLNDEGFANLCIRSIIAAGVGMAAA